MRWTHAPLGRVVIRTPALPIETLTTWTGDLHAGLVARVRDPRVREAIARASPGLDRAIDAWLAEPASHPDVEHAVVRYVQRIAGRSTPFGLFASVGVGAIGATSMLSIAGALRRYESMRIDAFADALRTLHASPRLRELFAIRANDSAYVAIDGQLRYIERTPQGPRIAEVEPTEELRATLERARPASSRDVLAEALCADPEISREDAAAFVDQLLAAGVLVSAHEPGVTSRLELPDGAPSPPASALAIDLHRETPELRVGRDVVDEVTRGLALLHRIGGAGERDPWRGFRARFEARYGTREVRLVDVLDEVTGLGFSIATDPITSPRRDAHLLTLALDGRAAIELSRADEAALAIDDPPRAYDVLAVGCSVSTTGQIAMLTADVPGVRMIARFGHGSPAIADLARELVAIEEARRPDAIFAELVHLPDTGAQAMVRPALRAYEIPYLGTASVDTEHQIAITDLVVSIVDDRVVVRSLRLGREVIPRLSSAYRHERSPLPVVRFLGALARQDGTYVGWSWGALAEAPRLPRITHGRVVLARARWTLDGSALASPQAIAATRARWQLPRWVTLFEDDTELPIDLDHAHQVASLARLVRGRAHVQLREMFPIPDELAVTGADGHYVHELQLFYARPASAEPARATPRSPSVPRSFPPGSEWLSLHCFANPRALDAVIRRLAPVAIAHATPWFFVRYDDPDWHLRFRIRAPLSMYDELHAEIADLVEQRVIWRVALDTYDREVERYGHIDDAERVFWADSVAVAALLADGDLAPAHAWLSIDRLLDDLGFALADKLAIVTEIRDGLGREHAIDTAMQRRLGAQFRRDAAAIAATLDAPTPAPFATRSAAIRGITASPDVARSLVHVACNRLFAIDPRRRELEVADALRRHYLAQLRRR